MSTTQNMVVTMGNLQTINEEDLVISNDNSENGEPTNTHQQQLTSLPTPPIESCHNEDIRQIHPPTPVQVPHVSAKCKKPERPHRSKKQNTYIVPTRRIPTAESLIRMKMPPPALLCDKHYSTFYSVGKFNRGDPRRTLSVVNDYFDILSVLGECNKWEITDWETYDVFQIKLVELSTDFHHGGLVFSSDDKRIGSWAIDNDRGSFGIIQELSDVTTLHKYVLGNRIRLEYMDMNGVQRDSFMYIVKNTVDNSYYLQEEMSWFRVTCQEDGSHVVNMLNIYGRPVRSAVQYKKVEN
jgi:hypothetical protein